MKVDAIFQKCQHIVKNPYRYAHEWKESKKGSVIGYFLMGMPDELIHAGGALPVAVMGMREKVFRAGAIVPGYICSLVRSTLDLGLSGQVDFLDFMFIPYLCDSSREMIHAWQGAIPNIPADSLRLPKKTQGDEVKKFLIDELNRVRRKIETIVGRPIADSDLSRSIFIYNENRSMLRRIYQYFVSHPGVISNAQMYALIKSSLFMRREEHTELLRALEPELERLERKSSEPDDTPLRVFLKGKIWEPPEIMEIFDALKIQVVGDDLIAGYRSIAEDIPADMDPLEGLIERHLRLSPYLGFHYSPERWSGFLPEAVKETKAEGVIFLILKFCEAASFSLPDLKKQLEEAGIPSLVIQTELAETSTSQISLRIQAFAEMVKKNDFS